MPLEELPEWAYSAARADQICFAKEALRLAVERLSEEQADVFWPTLGGATREECAVLSGVPKGRWGLACTVPGPSCAAPAQPIGCEQPFRKQARELFDEVEVHQQHAAIGTGGLGVLVGGLVS
jgi:hypothetical protein